MSSLIPNPTQPNPTQPDGRRGRHRLARARMWKIVRGVIAIIWQACADANPVAATCSR